MNLNPSNNPASGHILLKLLLLAIPCVLLLLIAHIALESLRSSHECQKNLRTLYRALEMYEMERGALPKLSFFPDLPTEDADSLRIALEPFGATASSCVCESAPHNFQELGLTYIWNTRLNGHKIPKGSQREWMLIEVQALSTDVPAPHWGRYHVLYSDGEVERIADPKKKLEGL